MPGRRPLARAGIGRCRRMAALPPHHRQPHDQDDQADLQDQADDRRQAAEAGEHPAAEQHAEQAGAEEAGSEAAEHAHAGLVEEAAAGSRGCRGRARSAGSWCGSSAAPCRAPLSWTAAPNRFASRGNPNAAATAGRASADEIAIARGTANERTTAIALTMPRVRWVNLMCVSSFPVRGKALLRWADLPKSEANIGNWRCGPRSRGCDYFAHDPRGFPGR